MPGDMPQSDACQNSANCGDGVPASWGHVGEGGGRPTEKCSYRPSAFSIAIMLSLQPQTWHI